MAVSVSGGVYVAEPGPVGEPLRAPCTTPEREPSRTAVASVLLSHTARPTSKSPTINNKRSGRTSAVSTNACALSFRTAEPKEPRHETDGGWRTAAPAATAPAREGTPSRTVSAAGDQG